MIIDYLEGDYKTLITTLFVVCFAWIVVIVAMLIDLYFGVKKAKELGEATSSEELRRTINKATYYFALMGFAFLFDIFDVVTPYFFPHPLGSIPFVSVFAALGLVLTEAKSVREKAEEKARRRTDESFRKILELMQNREDVMREIADHLKKERQKQEN
ncbi:MAG: phage holin family protein [Flavobacteriaceae bacterium]|nr:phage holin family protein [Flavobacteriaceae bacterium]